MSTESIVRDLERQRAELAVQGLINPTTRTEFEYGFLSGRVTALTETIQLLLNKIKEEKNR